ncbi:hypothetical protein ACIP6P_32570 [Streptomyces sp. NPDC088729]|uniref:hypothetical protein n=1 Tax=Streptomyces sp. NPDC088729 TaxID=3365876 RepID=UPI0038033A21
MTTRRPLGTGPEPATDDTRGLSPTAPAPRALLAAERLDGLDAAPPVLRPTGRRTLGTGTERHG